jgi:Protein of unknown function (DUF3303)
LSARMTAPQRVSPPPTSGMPPRSRALKQPSQSRWRPAGFSPERANERDVLFMVVEHFRPGAAADIYARVREGGRSLPEGLRYVDSWVRADLGGCFQLMECENAVLLQEWIAAWSDLSDFDVVPVSTSRATQELMARL